jgi:hypothetical protein
LATAAELINPQIRQQKKVRRLLCQTNKTYSRLNDPPLSRSAGRPRLLCVSRDEAKRCCARFCLIETSDRIPERPQ